MSAKKIKRLIRRKGMTINEVAERAGYHRVYVSYVIHGRFDSPRVRSGIAEALDADPSELWPPAKRNRGTTPTRKGGDCAGLA